MKPIRWKVLLSQAIFWLVTEMALSSVSILQTAANVDDLADYSEFLTYRHLVSVVEQQKSNQVVAWQSH